MRNNLSIGLVSVALFVTTSLAGCSLLGRHEPNTSLAAIEIVADAEANRKSATALDVVFVYEAGASPLLPTSGPAWFRQKPGLTNTLAKSVEVVTLEIPPAYRLSRVSLPKLAHHAVKVLAYANYLTEAGQAPIDLTLYKRVTIRLLAERIECRGE